MKTIGVLAVQGAFEAHARAVRELGHRAVLVRSPSDFEGLDGLVLPGGESSVQLDMIGRLDLEAPIRALVGSGRPVLATCAGLILVAHRVEAPTQRSFGLVDIGVRRNGWGRQIDSFEGTSDGGHDVVFIRAPRIVEVAPHVDVLDTLDGEPILVKQARVTCASFHPELTSDRGIHRDALALGTVRA